LWLRRVEREFELVQALAVLRHAARRETTP
jgi:hypothetical protein